MAAVAGLAWSRVLRGQERGEDDPARRWVRDRAKEAGLGRLGEDATEHYVGLGEAPDRFREEALGICEGTGRDYLKVFTDKGFEVAWPERPMVVAILSGPEAFGRFLGDPEAAAVGGLYDLDANVLMMFDNRARGGVNPATLRANTLALVHEALHQLTFNTGLLDRQGDVPLAISEGLAMYGEERPPSPRPSTIGRVNRGRLRGLVLGSRAGVAWTPVDRLLADDAGFDGTGSPAEQMALGESWLLVFHLLNDRDRLAQLRTYLASIRGRRSSGGRLDDARAAFGDLDALDAELRRMATRLTR